MNNLSNQALFQEGLDDLFDVIAWYQNAISLIKLRRIGCFCSLSVRKVVEEKCVEYIALALMEQREVKRKIAA